jgi:hypothetical protein
VGQVTYTDVVSVTIACEAQNGKILIRQLDSGGRGEDSAMDHV